MIKFNFSTHDFKVLFLEATTITIFLICLSSTFYYF